MNNKSHKFLLTIIAMIAFAIVVSVFGFYFYKFPDALSNSKADLGTLGDFVGGILNPLLSFLALIILLRTFSMQREELVIQREELKDTKEILKTQSQTQIKQQFESTFFALLNVHNQILDKNNLDLLNICKRLFNKFNDSVELSGEEGDNAFCKESEFFQLCRAKKRLERENYLCGHYLQTLYQTLKFVATNSPDSQIGLDFDSEKIRNSVVGLNEKMYSDIVRASLTSNSVHLLAVNCYCENEENNICWKYKLLIERYALLEHTPFDTQDSNNYPIFSEIRNFYDDKAFGL